MSEIQTRRSFFNRIAQGVSAAGVFVASLPKRAWSGVTETAGKAPEKHKAKWGMAIDLDLCTACGACTVACRSENNVPATGCAPGSEGTGIYWMDMLPKEKSEEQSEGKIDQVLPTPCMHCDNAPCVKVCPVGATYQSEEGIVAQIYDRCIGCRYCQEACPYSRRYFNWSAPEWPETYKEFLNPDVSTRPGGVVEKCSFCVHRIRDVHEKARIDERELTDADFIRLPSCAQSCPTQAITFGDLNDPESQVSHLHESPRASKLLEYLGTKPKVVYLAKDKRIGK